VLSGGGRDAFQDPASCLSFGARLISVLGTHGLPKLVPRTPRVAHQVPYFHLLLNWICKNPRFLLSTQYKEKLRNSRLQSLHP
jgi:hypothetical protein